MKKITIIIIFALLQISSILLWNNQNAYAYELTATIDELVKCSEASQTSSIGIYICELESGSVIYEKNPDQPMVPSSNLKLLTTAAALHYLGPDFTYKTKIYGTPIDKKRGVMESSLYLVGSGDPTFCEPYMNPTDILEQFANELSKKGLRRIIGDVIGDDSAFDREFTGKGWKDRYILDDYAAECGALSLNANLIQITAYNNMFTFFPECSILNIKNMTTPSGYNEISLKRDPNTNNVKISGPLCPDIAAGGTITVHNPPLFTTDTFGKILKNQGIYQTGSVKLIEESDNRYKYADFVELCSHESVKLLEILKQTNKDSDNLFAQHVFKTIGSEINGKGTHEYSEAAIKSFFKEAGIDTEGLVMADGCGLSDQNKVTARQLVKLLAHMYKHEQAKNFITTLPEAGVDGTLRYRLSGDKVFAKTGTINECSSLAGYVWTADNKIAVFAIITNNHQFGQGTYKGFEDLIVDTIAKSNL